MARESVDLSNIKLADIINIDFLQKFQGRLCQGHGLGQRDS